MKPAVWSARPDLPFLLSSRAFLAGCPDARVSFSFGGGLTHIPCSSGHRLGPPPLRQPTGLTSFFRVVRERPSFASSASTFPSSSRLRCSAASRSSALACASWEASRAWAASPSQGWAGTTTTSPRCAAKSAKARARLCARRPRIRSPCAPAPAPARLLAGGQGEALRGARPQRGRVCGRDQARLYEAREAGVLNFRRRVVRDGGGPLARRRRPRGGLAGRAVARLGVPPI